MKCSKTSEKCSPSSSSPVADVISEMELTVGWNGGGCALETRGIKKMLPEKEKTPVIQGHKMLRWGDAWAGCHSLDYSLSGDEKRRTSSYSGRLKDQRPAPSQGRSFFFIIIIAVTFSRIDELLCVCPRKGKEAKPDTRG